jgi:hypothetical protein
MGFFDDDNKKLEIAACAIVVLLGVYIGGFVMLRASNTNPCEEDGCAYELVDFPRGPARRVYLPLIGWDKTISRVRYTGEEYQP